MKAFFVLFLTMISFQATSSAVINCGPGQIRTYSPYGGVMCVTQYQQTNPGAWCGTGGTPPGPMNNSGVYNDPWFNLFPPQIFQPYQMPWWAYQGSMYYPNMYYPGAWNNNSYYPGIQSYHYDGNGQIFAGKPNVYVESIHKGKKFSFSFLLSDPSFLATTPALGENYTWKGKIQQDRFEVDGINYDYLFYDIRLPKEKMQFERGVCTKKEDTVQWMLDDLKEMKYPAIALQDFEEYWRVKIPDYPYYCIYPQYTKQLSDAAPVMIVMDQVRLTRSLYVLVPHRKEPNAEEPQEIPFPNLDPAEFRPNSLIKYETMFKEWGVAFIGE